MLKSLGKLSEHRLLKQRKKMPKLSSNKHKKMLSKHVAMH